MNETNYRKPIGMKQIVVIGAGNMGEGIAQSFAQAGKSVKVLARKKETLDRCRQQIGTNLKLFAEFQLLEEAPEVIKSRITYITMAELSEAIRGCHFIVETIPEVLADKKELFGKLDGCDPDVILASNTGSMTITTLTEDMKTAYRVVGTHYFNPAHIMPLVEIHWGKHTSDKVVQTTRDLMLQIGKKPILVKKEIPGFIVNRIQGAIFREVSYLLDEGIATPEDIDMAAKAMYGFRLSCIGPMEADDMIGLDTSARVSANLFKTLSNRTEPSATLLDRVNKGELGIKTGKGWYDYGGKTRAQVLDMINKRLLNQLVLFKARNR
ncbi:MAG: 3-hydroxyacyl-CoA dehydrogenase NAD-binding domain-containing protein [Dehalococcoidia bacterium]|nr:3-hydroxyacyl-CoA dehydrogenase NAD-binding domain-containing protein [Dehalococcoidia bacterium]MDH4366901.1 3-hydroxyacyl-CoA dehydrogenase NAD-binding domain-containing protein [Dehalococcoidia bacterium]